MDLDQFRHYTEWHDLVNSQHYRAPADPWGLRSVSPDEVRYYTNELRLNWGLGRVQGGAWDDQGHCRRIRETTLYRGLEQRFEEGRDWKETALYERARERFENGQTVRGYESLEQFRNVRCEYIDTLFETIEREGYRPNRRAGHEKASEENPIEDAYANHLEPLVVIARDGDIYWTEGNHRFAIASMLGIDEIPVLVLCRHEQWQQIREQVHDTPRDELPEAVEAHLDHLDLQELRE